MNSLKKFLYPVIISTVALVFLLFLFSPTANADVGVPEVDKIFSASITGGEFSVDKPVINIEEKVRIGSAVVSLPKGETGTIDEIAITGPTGKIFGCKNIKVQNGTDLIAACGGPAYLVPGNTTYQARGSNFQPLPDVQLSVQLSP